MTSWSYSAGSWRPAVTARPVSTSLKEITHLSIAFLVMTVDLILIAPLFGLFPNLVFASASYFLYFGLVGAAVAFTGFLAHELAHKIVAERLGFWAEFRMSPIGLLFSLVTAYFGFLFAAPGATVVDGITDAQAWGETSIAGPLTNLVFGALFYGSAIALKLSASASDLVPAILFISFFNGWIATFNLIPVGPLDGRKVYRWRPAVWGITIAASVAFAIVCYLAFNTGTPFPNL
jgi:Zn-dependent protease